jgi:hypothetical protein
MGAGVMILLTVNGLFEPPREMSYFSNGVHKWEYGSKKYGVTPGL